VTRPSRSRVDRAGKRLRDHRLGAVPLSEMELSVELAIVSDFRAAHADAMSLVAAGVRHSAAEVSRDEPEVGQRLKRTETILDKLVRQPTMALSRMQDVAGCRAVLPDQQTADATLDALRAHEEWVLQPKIWDYVTEPKPDGYRAKHVVVVVDDLQVEIQLRTTLQHMWAELVESIDRNLGLRTKFGESDPLLVEALVNASDAVAAHERGELKLAATMVALMAPIVLAYLKR